MKPEIAIPELTNEAWNDAELFICIYEYISTTMKYALRKRLLNETTNLPEKKELKIFLFVY